MALYTMELRTLCESMAGMSEHTEVDDIDRAIELSWSAIFGNDWDTYDPEYKKVLCRKILRHYWMREIGAETPGLFILWLRTRMEEIMPYYNQLYKSATLEFNPLYDYELTTTSKKTHDGTTTDANESKTTNTNESTVDTEGSCQRVGKFSDTPQGMLENVLSGTYLTTANVDDTTNTGKETSNSSGNVIGESNGTSTVKTTEDYLLTVMGKSGGRSYAKLLQEFRDTFLNIDKMIIENLHDLFMGLWA